jgi:lipopolysaccharide transport system ATP-binding protein
MSEKAIVVENLSKRYLIGHRFSSGRKYYKYTALRDVIGREISNFARKATDIVRGRQVVQGDEVEEFWALRDVSFEVKEGEILGIIGRNGAGKSTLLKILSRITEPTDGRVVLRGRVGSLLEVGTGFHPELTGRENIFLNGAILGMTQREIRRKFDEIVAFADVEKFLDTPVKHFSSGMYVRLAFAVAAHLEPELLLVDEVLAVGDAEFQKKCLGKMDDISRREGRTVLVISHNMGVITRLCARALWLERGAVRECGASQAVVGRYLARSIPSQDRLIRLDTRQRDAWIEDDRVRFTALEWLCPLPLQHGEQVKVRLHFRARAPVLGLSAILAFDSIEGVRVLTYHMALLQGPRRDIGRAGEYSVDLRIDALPLGPDLYNLNVVCRSGDLHILDFVEGCTQVDVVAGPTTPAAIANRSSGVRLEGEWSWEMTQ